MKIKNRFSAILSAVVAIVLGLAVVEYLEWFAHFYVPFMLCGVAVGASYFAVAITVILRRRCGGTCQKGVLCHFGGVAALVAISVFMGIFSYCGMIDAGLLDNMSKSSFATFATSSGRFANFIVAAMAAVMNFALFVLPGHTVTKEEVALIPVPDGCLSALFRSSVAEAEGGASVGDGSGSGRGGEGGEESSDDPAANPFRVNVP